MKLKEYLSFVKASGVVLLAFSLYTVGLCQDSKPVKVLNSPYDEKHPVISPTGEVFFSVGFHPENKGGPTDFGDIWMSKIDSDNNFNPPVRVPSLSTSGNDVVIGFLDVLTLLVYHSGPEKKQGIHQYSRFGNSWNYLRPLEMGNFKNNGTHFSGRLNRDGDVLVMSMSSFGSFGNEDIYVSFKQNEAAWSSPFNLGAQINTFAQEQTPYLSDDLQTLYFSSNVGSEGNGKDIFYAQRTGESWDQWTTPKPLTSTNSKGNELSYFSLPEDQGLAMFTSTQNSEGFGDFMMIRSEPIEPLADAGPVDVPLQAQSSVEQEKEEIPEKVVDTVSTGIADQVKQERVAEPISQQPPLATSPVNIKVLDASTMQEIGYLITLISDKGSRMNILNQQQLMEELASPQWENVLVSSKGYLPRELPRQDWFELENQTLLMKPAMAGTSIVLENIQFNRGTSDFADSKSIQILDNLVSFMKENPEVVIRLEGHTDNAGDPSLNKDLSMKRASKIRGYMTINGINFERVRISGWGGSKPVADNNTEEGRTMNRRVEMLIEN